MFSSAFLNHPALRDNFGERCEIRRKALGARSVREHFHVAFSQFERCHTFFVVRGIFGKNDALRECSKWLGNTISGSFESSVQSFIWSRGKILFNAGARSKL